MHHACLVVSLLASFLTGASCEEAEAVRLQAQAWQQGSNGEYIFPEMQLPDVAGKPSTAIAFTGGGTRAMVAAFGQLNGLRELGLLKNVRYITGISGGAWATAAFSFYQPAAEGVARNDAEFLCGDVTAPSRLNRTMLQSMDSRCCRNLATKDHSSIHPHDGVSVMEGVQKQWAELLKPIGVPLNMPCSWNNATVQDIKRRNVFLENQTFLLPSLHDHPFPIIGITLLGPFRLAPFQRNHRADKYVLLEFTPLYVGQARTANIAYAPLFPKSEPHQLPVGGFVEPMGFGMPQPLARALAVNETGGILDIPVRKADLQYGFTLANATYASSFVLGSFYSIATLPEINRELGDSINYWSVSDAAPVPRSEPFLLGDGGDFENVHVIGLLKRGVRSVVVFINALQPLHGVSQWDPGRRTPNSNDIDDALPAFFGVNTPAADPSDAAEQELGLDYSADQVFSTADFVPLVQEMQSRQAQGLGATVTWQHVTVANAVWGVEAGWHVNVTWNYLSRIGQWEEFLPKELQDLVVPKADENKDYGHTVASGPFQNFPHYSTNEAYFSQERANLLGELTGWSVLNNKAIFQAALADADHEVVFV